MSTFEVNESSGSGKMSTSLLTGSAWRGVLIGLVPLGFLLGMVAVTLLLTVLMRSLTAGAGFAVQQSAAVITLITGLILAIVVFAVAIWRVLRRVAIWQQGGVMTQASATLWALGLTGLVVVGPVLLALLLPQHPAP
jgi:hypothetical protein